MTETNHASAPSFRQALSFWWLLGWISFGGPAGQIAVMHNELVDRRRWVDENTFLHALNFCMVLPGPEAMQLATYLGWRLHGLRGGFAAGVLFVLPATFLMALLSWLYLRFGESSWVQGITLGLSAAVIALLAQALLRLSKRVLAKRFSQVLAVTALLALAVLGLSFPWLIFTSATLGVIVGKLRPQWLPNSKHGDVTAVATPAQGKIGKALGLAVVLISAWWLPLFAVGFYLGENSTSWALGIFFSKAALITFGGAYAVLPYVAQQAVEVQGWLSAPQMVVGLGLAESTPGPLIMVLEYVGFLAGWQHPDFASPLLSALVGAAITVWATFLPSFLFVLPIAPWISTLRDVPWLMSALSAITAAVLGVVANLALWFAVNVFAHAAINETAFLVLIASGCFYALQEKQWHVLAVVMGAAMAGLVFTALHR